MSKLKIGVILFLTFLTFPLFSQHRLVKKADFAFQQKKLKKAPDFI